MKNGNLWAVTAISLVLAVVAVIFSVSKAGGDQLFETPSPDATGAITSTTKAILKAAGFISTTGNLTVGGTASLGNTSTENLTTGGSTCTLTDANGGTYALTQSELATCSYLSFAAGGAGQEVIALTFPATSTLTTLIPNAGDCRSIYYDASALATATTTTITAGTGIDVIAYTTADDVIDGNEFAQITMCRQPDSDVSLFTSEMLQAD